MLFIIQEDDIAKECECRQLRIAEEKLKSSGISEEFRKKTFDNFNYEKSVKVKFFNEWKLRYSKTWCKVRKVDGREGYIEIKYNDFN